MGNNYPYERWYLAAGMLASLAAGISPFLIAPEFQSVYRKLNQDLPLITNLALRFYPVLLALPLALVAIWFVLPNDMNRGKVVWAIGIGSLFLVPAAYVYILNLPIR
jgi:hypothetical protein